MARRKNPHHADWLDIVRPQIYMQLLAVQIVRFVDVEGRKHTILEKVPVVSCDDLERNTLHCILARSFAARDNSTRTV